MKKSFRSDFKCKNWRSHREILYSLGSCRFLVRELILALATRARHLVNGSELHISMRMTTVFCVNQLFVSYIVLEKKSSRIFTSISKIMVLFLVNIGTRVAFLQMVLSLTLPRISLVPMLSLRANEKWKGKGELILLIQVGWSRSPQMAELNER